MSPPMPSAELQSVAEEAIESAQSPQAINETPPLITRQTARVLMTASKIDEERKDIEDLRPRIAALEAKYGAR